MGEMTVGNPGGYARLEMLKADEGVVEDVYRMLCERKSLRAIAKEFGVPRGAFARWFMAEHGDLVSDADRVLAHELKHEALEEAEAATEENAVSQRLKVDTALKLMPMLDRDRYGKQVQHRHEHTFDLGDRLRRAMERAEAVRQERIVELEPARVSEAGTPLAEEPAPARAGLEGSS